MRLRRAPLVLLCLAAVPAPVRGVAASSCPVVVYIQGIQQAADDVSVTPPRIGDAVTVLTRDISGSSTLIPVLQPVVNDLQLTPPALDDARSRLQALASVLSVPAGATCGVDSAPALGALHDVYASPVFANLNQTQPPGIFEQIGNVVSWIISHLVGAVGGSVLLAIAAVLVGLLLLLLGLRLRASGAGRRARAIAEPAEAGDDPDAEWRAAERAAARGEFREAVRRAFRCALLEVAHRGRMRVDAAWTTRELLSAARGDPPLLAALAAAAESFDVAWYSGRTTTESDWREARSRCENVRALARRAAPSQAA